VTDLGDVVAFLAVTDLDRAERFFGGVLGLELRDERPFALVATGPGGRLRITLVESLPAVPHTVLGWNVTDIETTIDVLSARGVTFTRYDGMGQDTRGIWTAPGGARIAWFLDPDGNNLSLTQHPEAR
jgi:predicted enzyme related to lactoylglutathione lyase